MTASNENLSALPRNTSFSVSVPNLQIAIDSTSLGEFKQCPRKYELKLVHGWRPGVKSIHLIFGDLMHKAIEFYDHKRAEGANHAAALEATVDWALRITWDKGLARPRADLADSIKNRNTLLRTIVWYLDQYGDNEMMQTVVLANGKPAVELSFAFDSQLRYQSTSEPILLCGHLDRIVSMNEQFYIRDIKTTKSALAPYWFDSFSPDNQFSLYSFAGKVAFGVPVEGVIVDGVQLGVGFSRFARGMVLRTKEQLQEWYVGLGYWVAQIETCATRGVWPQNDKACGMYGGCEFRAVCSKSPQLRETVLRAGYTKEVWDPMQKRGESPE